MRTKFNGILTLLLALIVQMTFAQEKTVSGTVSDEAGPLPGVTIIKKGTTQGTETDFDGKYSIKVNTGDVLVYSFIGMKTTEKTVGTSSSINVVMQSDNILDEVVLTGYGTTTRAKASTASTQLNAETIENRPNGSIVQTLAGQVPGLDISTNSGQPGANSLVQLRGVSSINGNTEPLFIMDGVPINEDNFRSLNQNDIASIVVLKDAGATAVYGSRGANGVVVIKTKQGRKNSGLKVRYNSILSFSSLQGNDYDLMNSQDYVRLERTRGVGIGAGNALRISYPANGGPLTDAQIDALPTEKWIDVFMRTGMTQNHTLALTSGGENSSQFTSLGYFKQEGLLKNSDLKRFNLRNNINGGNDKFKYGTSVSLNYSKSDSPTSVGGGGVNQNPFFGAYSSLPYLTEAGKPTSEELSRNAVFAYSPYFIMDKLFGDKAISEELKIVASINGSYNFTDNLSASVTTGIDYESTVDVGTRNPLGFNALLFNRANPGFQTQSSDRRAAFNTTASLKYNKEIGKHTFNAGLYTEYFKAHLRNFGYRSNGLNPKTFSPGDGAGFIDDNADNDLFVDTVFANKIDAGLLSYFGTLDYDFDSKYGLSLTYRRDASYRFSSTNRWANFYSVSGRWNLDKEEWMQDTAFNTLKLRTSYGTSGNQRITGNSYFSGPDLALDLFNTGTGYEGLPTIGLSQLGNDTLKWETVTQFNVGLDFGLFNNRLRGSFDYYRKKTSDLFQNLPLSAITGTTALAANTGSLNNNGFDFDLAYDIVQGEDLNITINTVGNFNENTLSDIPNETGEIIGIGRNGGPIGERYEIRYAGVNPANGNVLFLDKDGNLTETPDADTDRVWTGKNITPEVQGSFGLNVDYKGFFLQTQFNYTLGVDFSDFDYANFIDPTDIGTFNLSKDILRAWTPDNRETDIPTIFPGSNVGVYDSDRFVVDRDFLRMRFITFGYNFPSEVLNRSNISSLRLFMNAENLFTLTKFRGYDASSRDTGRTYPTPRIISLGLEIGL